MAEVQEQVFKPKVRITLLSKEGVPVSDKLMDSYYLYSMGPKEKHDGPIRVEITLQNKQDVSNFKEYLDRLSGDLPLKEVGTRGRIPGNNKELENPREDILKEVQVMAEQGKDQKEVVKYLRNLGFKFILTEEFLIHFKDFEFNSKDVGESTNTGQYPHSYSWMVRQIKEAKDPKSDKWDPQIIFGFSILEGPSKKVIPYLYRERQKPIKIAPVAKALTFSKVGFSKFPAWMLEDERLKFSTEIRQLIGNPEKNATKFFLRWMRDVELPPETWEKLKGRGLIFKNFKD